MASETRKGLLRVSSNYARLLATVVLGVILVPILLRGFGPEAFSVYALLGATAGFASLFKDLMRFSMNRELGHAWNHPDASVFPAVYNAAIVVALGMAGLSAVVFGVLFLCLPLLTIPDPLMTAARWVVVSAGVNTFFTIVMAPQFRMYMAMERVVSYNVRTTAERAAYVLVASVLFFGIGIKDPARGLTYYTVFSNLLSVLILLVSVVAIILVDRRLMPNLGRTTREALRSVSRTGGWNVLTVLAMNLHIRLDQLIVNVLVAPAAPLANGCWGLAVTLTSYVRMLTVGVTDGLDTVAARMSATGKEDAIRRLMRASTRMNAWVAAPAGVLILAMTEPILKAWVGLRDPKAAALIPGAILVVQVLTVGMTVRAVTDNWTRIMYGAGHVRHYAKQIFIGGLLNPLISVVLIFLLPPAYDSVGPAIAYTGIFVAVHFVLLPLVGATCLGVRPRDMITPALPPAIVAAALCPIPLAADRLISLLAPDWLLLLAIVGAAAAVYTALYLLLSWRFVLSAQERSRLFGLLRRRKFGPGSCRACGHDVAGLAPGSSCPECSRAPRGRPQRAGPGAVAASSTSTAL